MKRSVDALRNQARLLDLALDAIMVREYASGAIRLWNAGAEKTYGWSRQEAADEVVDVLLRTEFPCPLAKLESQLLETGRWEGELVRVARDGTRFSVWSRWGLQRGTDNQPIAILMIDHDIGERKAAEEARVALAREQAAHAVAEAERRRLADLFAQTPAAILVTRGPDHRIELASPQFVRAVGLESADSLVGRPVSEALPHFFRAGAGDILTSVYRDGNPVVGTEVRWLGRPDDDPAHSVFFNVVWQPRRNLEDEPEGVLFLGLDVTELVRARQRIEILAAEEEAARVRLEAVIGQLPAGVMIADAHTERLLLANAQIARIFHRSLAPGGSVTEFIEGLGFHANGESYRAADWPLIRSVRYGESVYGEEFDYVRPDGSRATIRMSSAPIRDRGSRVIAAVATIDEVSARKRTEDAVRFLAEAGQAFSQTLDYDGTLQAIARVPIPRLATATQVYLNVGDRNVRCVALACTDQLLEATWSEEMSGLLYDRTASNAVTEAARTGAASRDTLVALLGQGSWKSKPWMSRLIGLCVPLTARGQIIGSLVLARPLAEYYDSSDLSVAEELARRAAIALDNARLYQEAQEALQARDQILSFASHDLRNPLTAIKGTTQILQRRVARLGSADVEPVLVGLGNIDSAATRMSSMISELLDVARLQMGQSLVLDRRPTDLHVVVNRVVAEYRQLSKRHRIAVEASDVPAVGEWDGPRLERVLDNLLSNAIKYSPDGGEVRIAIDLEDDAGGAWAVLKVSDEGIGIPAADLPHVFESFRRAANAVGRRPGVGLGLAGTQRIVHLHGGHIVVESREGEGSTFTVRLPL